METNNNNNNNNPNGNVVYYTLIDSDERVHSLEYEKLLKKSKNFFSCSGFCLLFSLIFIFFAAVFPMWSVNVITGPPEIFMVDSDEDVNFLVGSGIFVKNVCIFFDVKPSDEILARFEVNCDSSSTLNGCEFDSHGRDINGNEECNRMQAAQSLSSSSIISLIFALIIGCCSSPEKRIGKTISFLFSLLSIFSAYSVLQVMRESNLMKQSMTGCRNEFGAKVCNEFSPSTNFQIQGIVFLMISITCLLVSMILVKRAILVNERATRSNQVSTIRYAIPAGVIVV